MKRNKYNTESYIQKAKLIHGKKYDYSKTSYVHNHQKLIIICPEHGDFEVRASNHITKQANGCIKCGEIRSHNEQRKSMESFLNEANKVHNFKYDYSDSQYKNFNSKISIKCNTHGNFTQLVSNHLNGMGCSKCSFESREIKPENFDSYLIRFKEVHNDYYNYEKSIYKGYDNKILVICPLHGDFECAVYNHLKGRGCPKCRRSKGELEISKWLDNNSINYIDQYKINECRNIRPLPFDFYIESHNLLIEFQGEQHSKQLTGNWTRYDLKSRQETDLKKKNFALNNNYNFLEINFNENIKQKLNEYFKKT